MSKQITAHLMGGLGNQMFQYAAARGIAHRNNVPLFVDDHNGFVRDIVYKRTYELNSFPIQATVARRSLQYETERVRLKIKQACNKAVNKNLFWTVLEEYKLDFFPEIVNYEVTGNTWMHGYWQCEKYFEDIKEQIAAEFTPQPPTDEIFLAMAAQMNSCNSVALGVRLFEEVPGANKEGVGGLISMNFFNEAAKRMAAAVENPEFFVFCTTNAPELEQLELPGKVHLITHDNDFHGTIERFWLLTQCRHHIIANSSFYWWAAWLAEMRNEHTKVIASATFPNRNTVPERWM